MRYHKNREGALAYELSAQYRSIAWFKETDARSWGAGRGAPTEFVLLHPRATSPAAARRVANGVRIGSFLTKVGVRLRRRHARYEVTCPLRVTRETWISAVLTRGQANRRLTERSAVSAARS